MSTPSNDGGTSVAASGLRASGPTEAPWLKILGSCLRFTAAAVVLLAGAALIVSGLEGALSVLFGAAVVVLFFAISLLIGHYAGRKNLSGAVGLFLVTYAIKVVGFAAVLFLLGVPDWLHRTWFGVAAIVAVVLWQVGELYAFSRIRHQLYDDAPPARKDS